jgi:hypothetical protein
MSKKPVVAWVIVVVAALAALSDCLSLLTSSIAFGRRPVQEVAGTVMLCAPFAALSAIVIRATLRGTFRSRTAVSLYLWGLLISEPVANVLRAVGWYLPRAPIADNELAGAAFAELMRYVILLSLIVWVGFSKALKAYFAQGAPNLAAAG